MDNQTHLLWSEFSRRLLAFIRRRVRNEADAEDILQEVFLRIHQRAASVNDADRLTGWLFQVTRNAIADFYRAPVRREVAVGAADDPAFAQPPDFAPLTDEIATCLRPLLTGLSPTCREAIALVDLGGVTQPEAARQLGLSVSGMKSRVQRGRQALRRQLDACCAIEVDAGGRLTDFATRDAACGCFGPQRSDIIPAGAASC
jgi:RNA polymerase sigma-70 factor (ECF subfamily)